MVGDFAGYGGDQNCATAGELNFEITSLALTRFGFACRTKMRGETFSAVCQNLHVTAVCVAGIPKISRLAITHSEKT